MIRGVLLGYARVSTGDQNPDHQTDALARAGVAPGDVYLDHASGAKASRPQLDAILRNLRDGDVLVVTRLDRLGRSVLHLVQLGAQLRERGVGLRVLEQGIDTSTAEGRAMFGMLSVLAEFQRELIAANTRDGLAAPPGPAAASAAGPRACPPPRPRMPARSTTPVSTRSPRSAPCSGSRGPRCMGISTAAPPGPRRPAQP